MWIEKQLNSIIGFDWDAGNNIKNCKKPQVSNREAEEIFFQKPRVISRDVTHLITEARFSCLGKTSTNRFLCVVFIIRHQKIRVISAMDQNKIEKQIYAKKSKSIT